MGIACHRASAARKGSFIQLLLFKLLGLCEVYTNFFLPKAPLRDSFCLRQPQEYGRLFSELSFSPVSCFTVYTYGWVYFSITFERDSLDLLYFKYWGNFKQKTSITCFLLCTNNQLKAGKTHGQEQFREGDKYKSRCAFPLLTFIGFIFTARWAGPRWPEHRCPRGPDKGGSEKCCSQKFVHCAAWRKERKMDGENSCPYFFKSLSKFLISVELHRHLPLQVKVGQDWFLGYEQVY